MGGGVGERERESGPMHTGTHVHTESHYCCCASFLISQDGKQCKMWWYQKAAQGPQNKLY